MALAIEAPSPLYGKKGRGRWSATRSNVDIQPDGFVSRSQRDGRPVAASKFCSNFGAFEPIDFDRKRPVSAAQPAGLAGDGVAQPSLEVDTQLEGADPTVIDINPDGAGVQTGMTDEGDGSLVDLAFDLGTGRFTGSNPLLATGKYLAVLPRSVAVPWLGSGAIREVNAEINSPLRPLGFLWHGTAPGRQRRHLPRT